MRFEIEGKIKKGLFIETYYDKINSYQSFTKNKLLVDVDGENIVLEFSDKNCELVKYCNSNQVIIFFVKLKVRSWLNKNSTIYSNDLICENIKVLHTIKNYKNAITYKNAKFIIKRERKEKLSISLYNIENEEFIEICSNYDFLNKELHEKHVVISEQYENGLLEILLRQGILSKVNCVLLENNRKGYVCKVLVLHLFNSYGFLPIHSSPFFGINKNFPFTYTQELYHSSSEDETDYSNFNDDLDYDQQSDEFWNQF